MKSRNQKNNVINFPTNMSETEREIEAILFAAEEPLDIESIRARMKTKADVPKILDTLEKQYRGRGCLLYTSPSPRD